jgi:hypothetical protein
MLIAPTRQCRFVLRNAALLVLHLPAIEAHSCTSKILQVGRFLMQIKELSASNLFIWCFGRRGAHGGIKWASLFSE